MVATSREPATTEQVDRATQSPPPAAAAASRPFGPDAVLSLQRTAGNVAVCRFLARTPANHPMRPQIEAVRAVGELGTLAFERDRVRASLTEKGTGNRKTLLGTERVMDALLASGRAKPGYGAIFSRAQEDAIGARHHALAQVATHGVNLGLGYAAKRARTPEDLQQVELVRKDIRTVQDEFRDQTRSNARLLLDESQGRIVRMLQTYGLWTAHATPLVEKVANDKVELESAVDEWIEHAGSRRADYEAPGAVGARRDLTRRIDELRGLQKTVGDLQSEYLSRFGEAPLDEGERRANDRLRHKAARGPLRPLPDISPAAKELERQINEARRKLSAAWIAAEREHPVLAAHRGREGRHLEWVDLGGYAAMSAIPGDGETKRRVRIYAANRAQRETPAPGAHERAAVREAVRKLANIHRALAAIRQGKLSPLELAPVVRFTEKQLMIAPRSAWAAAVKEVVKPERGVLDKGLELVKDLLDFAMVALSALPTPLAGAAMMYEVGRNTYVALSEYVKHDLEQAYADTDLDVARSLSDKVPSLTGFAVALLAAGLAGTQLKSAFEAAAAARRGLLAGDESALRTLDEIGERYGVPAMGDDVARAEGLAARPAKGPTPPARGTGTPPSGARPVTEEELAAAAAKRGRARPETPKRETRVKNREQRMFHTRVSDLRKHLRKALEKVRKQARQQRVKGAPREINQLLRELRKRDRTFARRAKRYFDAIDDPKFLEKQMVYLWQQARKHERTVAEELEHILGGGGGVNPFRNSPNRTPAEEYAEFREAIRDPRPLVDMSYAGDVHGSHTHMFHQFLGDRLFGKGEGLKFRQRLTELTGPSRTMHPGDPGEHEKPFWSRLWDALFDADGGLHRPEELGRILQQHLDFPQWDP